MLEVEPEWQPDADQYPIVKELHVGLATSVPANMVALTQEEADAIGVHAATNGQATMLYPN